jgi:hypothetical protein
MTTDDDRNEVLVRTSRLLGPRRLEEYLQYNASLHVMSLCLTLSITAAMGTGHQDEFLDHIRLDAQDLRDAADRYAAWAERLADDWHAQRQEQTS